MNPDGIGFFEKVFWHAIEVYDKVAEIIFIVCSHYMACFGNVLSCNNCKTIGILTENPTRNKQEK